MKRRLRWAQASFWPCGHVGLAGILDSESTTLTDQVTICIAAALLQPGHLDRHVT